MPPPPAEPPKGAGGSAAPDNGQAKEHAKRHDKGKRCPICGRPGSEPTLPFCSPRCRDVDLHRWLSGSYVIPSRDDEADGEE
jgi:endogenous inhibitor of DNA gyrase (YacG/DUF329 family)